MYKLQLKPIKYLKVKCLLALLCLLVCSATAYAQSRIIQGTVTDDHNEPIPGVSVSVKSSGKSTSANADGRFTITVNGSADVVTFTFVGFVTKEVRVGEGHVLNVSLTPDIKQLNDVVVIGYGTSSRSDVTGSITTVKSEDFNQGVLTTPAELLQGKVAGLNITKSGDPNSAPAVILRGPSTIRTLNGGVTTPFYVVDGVPGVSVDLLAPDDIESIDVLKDAASTAIYGSRAANGVIIITTKKAKPGQTRLTYSSYVAMEKVSKQIDMLSGDQLRNYIAQNGLTPFAPIDNDGANTNWQNVVERTGYNTNQNLSFSGSSTNADYGASANYFKDNGIIRNTSLQRTILKGYINQRFFNDRLKLGITLTNSATINDDVPQQYVLPAMLYYLPTVTPFNAAGGYNENVNRNGTDQFNPLSLINNNTIQTNDNKTLITGIAQVNILKGFTYTLTGSTQKDQSNQSSYYNSQSLLAYQLNGVAHRSEYLNVNDVIESYFNYDHSFGLHSIKLLAGYSWEQDSSNDGFGIQTQNFADDALGANNLFLSNPSQLSQIAFDNNPSSVIRFISYYARAQYQYSDKYLLQVSLRNDGSSAFGANDQFGYFPAASAGWRIINEKFMQHYPVFSDLKLRAGYGVTGNSEGFNAYSALLIYGTQPGGSTKFLNNGTIQNAIGPVANANPNLHWESTATTDIGLDFGLFQNRITGSFDYYIKKTTNLIDDDLPVSLTEFLLPTYTANVGSMTNKGIEVVLNFVPVKTKDFTWRSSMNFAHNNNRIDNLTNSQFTIPYIQTAQLGGKGQSGDYSQIIEPGLALGTFDLWKYLGKNAAGLSTYQTANGTVTTAQPLTTDQMIGGNAQPNLIYGWTNTFVYKQFDLNFLLRGVLGNKILNATLAGLNDPVDAKLQNIPQFTLSQNEKPTDLNADLISSRYLENGSYLRLDNATLGYTIKPKTPGIKSIRLYFSGNNIFVITKYQGIDPEVNIGGLTPGIDNNNFYPKTRTFSFGVNASF